MTTAEEIITRNMAAGWADGVAEVELAKPKAPPVEESPEAEPGLSVLPSPQAPAEVARQIEAHHVKLGRPYLISGDEWYRYVGDRYERLSAGQAKADMYRLTEHATWVDGEGKLKKWNPGRGSIAGLLDAFSALTDTFAESGSWVGKPGDRPDFGRIMIPMKDGILDAELGVLLPHDPHWFFTYALPCDYDSRAQCPVWLKMLEAQWGEQPDVIQALQEWFGYVLSGRTDLHKMALMYGPRRSAKGLVARILQTLLGGSGQGMNLSGLASEYGMTTLIGSPLAILGDVRWTGVQGVSQAVSRLLEISGEDTISVPRKYKDAWSGKLPTRLMFLSNDEPTLPDASGALASRMLVFHTSQSFLGREDPSLEPRIRAELAGVLNWALAGLDRLNDQGRFTETAEAADQLAQMTAAGSPVAAFVQDCCDTTDGEAFEHPDELYSAYRDWCFGQNLMEKDKPRFAQMLRSVVPQKKGRVRRSIDGRAVLVMLGIRLKAARGASDFEHTE
jgi:putative DNA primase/helicase